MWHQGFNRKFTKLREYFLYAKKTKITTLFNSSSPLRQHNAILDYILWTETAYSLLCQPHREDTSFMYIYALIWSKTSGLRLTQKSVRSFRPADILQNGAMGDAEEMNVNKVVFFLSFAHKKYSRSFVKLRLNPWCHMDYFTNLLATFLDLDRVRTLAVYGGSESSQIPSKIL